MSDQIDSANRILDNSVFLKLEFRRIGTSKKVHVKVKKQGELIEAEDNSGVMVSGVDEQLIRASKKILQSPEIEAISKHDSETRSIIASRALPSTSMFQGGGMWLMRLRGLTATLDLLKARQAERQRLVDRFLDRYSAIIEQDRERLGPEFVEDQYPTREKVEESFSMAWQVMSFSTPENIRREISQDVFEECERENKARFATFLEDVTLARRAALLKIVEHVRERLAPDADGKRKTFRDSMVEGLRDWCSTFDEMNVNNDEELAATTRRLRQMIDGVDPEALRSDDAMRERVDAGMAEITAELDTMLVPKAARRMRIRRPEDEQQQEQVAA